MIILDKVEKQTGTDSSGKRVLKVTLNADTASEVIAIGDDPATVEGMPNDTVIAPFSTCFTASQELLVLDSSGIWQQ